MYFRLEVGRTRVKRFYLTKKHTEGNDGRIVTRGRRVCDKRGAGLVL